MLSSWLSCFWSVCAFHCVFGVRLPCPTLGPTFRLHERNKWKIQGSNVEIDEWRKISWLTSVELTWLADRTLLIHIPAWYWSCRCARERERVRIRDCELFASFKTVLEIYKSTYSMGIWDIFPVGSCRSSFIWFSKSYSWSWREET